MLSDDTALWFDVGIKRYTTMSKAQVEGVMLWFDVGIKRYTTFFIMFIFFD